MMTAKCSIVLVLILAILNANCEISTENYEKTSVNKSENISSSNFSDTGKQVILIRSNTPASSLPRGNLIEDASSFKTTQLNTPLDAVVPTKNESTSDLQNTTNPFEIEENKSTTTKNGEEFSTTTHDASTKRNTEDISKETSTILQEETSQGSSTNEETIAPTEQMEETPSTTEEIETNTEEKLENNYSPNYSDNFGSTSPKESSTEGSKREEIEEFSTIREQNEDDVAITRTAEEDLNYNELYEVDTEEIETNTEAHENFIDYSGSVEDSLVTPRRTTIGDNKSDDFSVTSNYSDQVMERLSSTESSDTQLEKSDKNKSDLSSENYEFVTTTSVSDANRTDAVYFSESMAYPSTSDELSLQKTTLRQDETTLQEAETTTSKDSKTTSYQSISTTLEMTKIYSKDDEASLSTSERSHSSLTTDVTEQTIPHFRETEKKLFFENKNFEQKVETTQITTATHTPQIFEENTSTTEVESSTAIHQKTITPEITIPTFSVITESPKNFPPTKEITTNYIETTTPKGISPLCKATTISNHSISISKSLIIIQWTLDSPVSYLSNCQLKINVSCDSTDDFDWVIPHQSSHSSVDDSKPYLPIGLLSEFTNYSCLTDLYIDDEDQIILSSETYNVTTKKEVPSNILPDITNVTDRSFIIEWQRPSKIPGNLQTYFILIKKNSLHYIREDCSMDSVEVTIPYYSEKENISYSFLWAEPNYMYTVKILANDEAGNSIGIPAICVTDDSPSSAPLNVTTKTETHKNHCSDGDYNATLQITWELPCNTNGNLREFEVNVTEKVYLEKKFAYTANTGIYRIPANSKIQNLTYHLLVKNLNASCAYEISTQAITGDDGPDIYGVPSYAVSERTKDGCPSKPNSLVAQTSETSFSLQWKEPEEYYGKVLDYNVVVTGLGPKHTVSMLCPESIPLNIEKTTNTTTFEVKDLQANFAYECKIQARTSAGLGNASVMTVVTSSKESEAIRELKITKLDEVISYGKYIFHVRVDFQEPCNTNGFFRTYMVEEKGQRQGYPTVYNIVNISKTSYETVLRKPDYNYQFSICVVTELFISQCVEKNITTSASIPMVDESKILCFVDEENPTNLNVEIEKSTFNEDSGEILYYAIYLFEGIFENSSFQASNSGICNGTCPMVNETTYPFIKTTNLYQITPKKWNPFTDGIKKITISIGKKEHCDKEEFCQALSEDTNYIVLLRAFTKNTYSDAFLSAKTGISPSSASLFFISFIVLVVIAMIGLYVYYKRTQFFTIFRSIPSVVIEDDTADLRLRHVVAVKQFIAYYNKIQNDPSLLKKQFEEIEEEIRKYKEENVHTTFALKPENKRKNRYTNILPYDECRVKLNMDEDDEISSDYINASYIMGVTGKIEYIATQGPLEHTCKDFWKMVIQENVSVIVMVSQFVEKEKEKCYKYFPKNHENMLISEDLEVKCLTELQFDTYCVRTLMIKKDIRQYSVIHMQYLDWPDFGCPTGTYNMLTFCEEVRERIQIEKGLMAVHCSAGVGRTGTLISLDMLLQTMKKEKEISVFECVMDLRKQRTHMVQTEKQYVYIHTCLKDVLENSSLYSIDDAKKKDEHTYENIKNEKIMRVKDTNCEEIESAL